MICEEPLRKSQLPVLKPGQKCRTRSKSLVEGRNQLMTYLGMKAKCVSVERVSDTDCWGVNEVIQTRTGRQLLMGANGVHVGQGTRKYHYYLHR
jgi:hypothetical protein